ncbi:TetR/AcrR family transcriptional regulator [Streptomyces sp. NPDC101227]|uniref:TetR/AcrR family transcriptional regulator n=1 Tax=Streptomyces sp. NPDC101227 TaxID=3366136 RepID=UPI00380A7DF6
MAASGRAAGPEVIWARPERTGRGPRPAFTRDEIAEAAVRIADESGLAAVSMRRVATAVGCATMSLYNYVPAKGDLVDLMVDHVSGEYELPAAPSGDWRADLFELARQARDMMRRHPWLPGAVLSHHFLGPNALRYLEFCLAALEGSGLDDGLRVELVSMVNGTVITMASSEQAAAERAKESGHTAGQLQAAQAGYLAGVVGGGRYPLMARAFAKGAPPTDPDAVFARVIGRVLDAYAGHETGGGPGLG